ncbi:aspartyl/asparaginyl beta-hydroxylase domain-containing protein [Terriglobus roseus]
MFQSELQRTDVIDLLPGRCNEGKLPFDFLIGRGATHLRHAGSRSLLDHLDGTRRLLEVWKQDLHLQHAGLFHSVYSTESYHHSLIPLSERDTIRELIGEQAERLAYLFCVVPRSQYLSLARFGPREAKQVRLHDTNFAGDVVVGVDDVRDLVTLYLANIVEQPNPETPRFGNWLQDVSQAAAALRSFGAGDRRDPLPFVRELDRPECCEFRYQYLRGCDALSDGLIDEAIDHIEKALVICDWLPDPWLILAIAQAGSNGEEWHVSSRKGFDLLNRWGTAWDRNISHRLWDEFGATLTSRDGLASMRPKLIDQHMVGRKRLVHNCGEGPWPGRFMDYLQSMSSNGDQQMSGWYPSLPSKPIYESRALSISRLLEDNFPKIKSEVEELSGLSYHREAEPIPRKGDWDVFFLYEQGRRNDLNCSQVPTIAKIIDKHPAVRRESGLVYISRLGANSNVAPHNGPLNSRLRLHLALRVPAGDCGMRVGNETLRWSEGECIVFDDFVEHEVWNRTDQERLVLLMDLWHPELTDTEREAIDILQRFGNKRGFAIAKYWERNRAACTNGKAPLEED